MLYLPNCYPKAAGNLPGALYSIKGTAGELRKYLLERTKLCLEIESAHNLVFIEVLDGSCESPGELGYLVLVRARLAVKEIQAFQLPKL